MTVTFALFISLQEDHRNLGKDNLAIQGYDPVSYFQGKPKEGDEKTNARYEGALYYFSSVENKNIFTKTSEKYIPQFGGWCAYALGLGPEKVKIDPKTYKIINGKLYLFYNFWGNNTLESWNENESALLKEAEKNWENIIN